MNISVLGATGAMGGFVIKAALQEGLTIVNKVSSQDNIEKLFQDTDVIVDFSCPMATDSMLTYILEHSISTPVVIGTTGLSDVHRNMMAKCAALAPVFYSTNMSFVVSLLNIIVYATSKLLNEDFDVEIFDKHHKFKKDAPSGTALMLGKTVAKARNREFEDIANFIRYGIIEQRKKGEIGFCVQRCSNVIGTHEISFMGELENLKFTHEAHSKEIFAKGAIKAAKWIIKQPNGLYTMNEFTKELMIPAVKNLYREFFYKK